MLKAVKSVMRQLYEGLLINNPVLVQMLGLCPVLAVSTNLENGLGMGIAVTAVLICSNLVISLLQRLIPQRVRIPCYAVIIATFATIADLLLQAYYPGLSRSLGIFVPLIAANCLIFARAEAFASKNNILRSVIDGLAMGLGFILAITLVSSVREILSNGTILGIPVFGDSFRPVLLFAMPSGGFLALGVLAALFQAVIKGLKRRKRA